MVLPRSARKAFTLVELLVVIAIIGTLIALLLPAVQAARESARMSQCKNNLKQMGLTLQTYHDTKRQFPSGRVKKDDKGVSWAFELLPYMEQRAIYDAWDPTASVFDVVNSLAMRTPVETFYCPSRRSPAADRDFDNNGNAPVVLAAAAGGDYAASAGEDHNFEAELDDDADVDDPTLVAGVIHTFSKISARNVTDGLSNTLAIGERHIPLVQPDFDQNKLHHDQGDTAFFASDNPRTIFAEWDIAKGPNDGSSDEFGSEHGQLVNFVFLDGHVASISRDIDEETFRRLCTYADGQIVSTEDL
ncbi:MAG: DUF1559 domain-containing protein [Pseudomonadales bacterium]